MCIRDRFQPSENNVSVLNIFAGKQKVGTVSEVDKKTGAAFDIKQTVVFIDIDYAALVKAVRKQKIVYQEVSRFPAMQRDLAMIVNNSTTYASIEAVVQKLKLSRLQDMRLFDVFESDKLGTGKKSMAISFTFADEEKTLTDKEADAMMSKLIQALEKELGAEIRK